MAAADAIQTLSVFREKGLFRLSFYSAGGGEEKVSAARCISVFIDGLLERWIARSRAPVAEGQRLHVSEVDGLVLHVQPAGPDQQ